MQGDSATGIIIVALGLMVIFELKTYWLLIEVKQSLLEVREIIDKLIDKQERPKITADRKRRKTESNNG